MHILTRQAVIDRIEGVFDTEEPDVYRLHFQDGTGVLIKNCDAIEAFKVMAECFGSTHGSGDLNANLKGKRIVYCMNKFQFLVGFTPAEDWDGPEMEDGEFFIRRLGYCFG